LVRIVRAERDAILSYDQQIETLAREHPDFAIIDSLPGVGPALAPRLIRSPVNFSAQFLRCGVAISTGPLPVLGMGGSASFNTCSTGLANCDTRTGGSANCDTFTGGSASCDTCTGGFASFDTRSAGSASSCTLTPLSAGDAQGKQCEHQCEQASKFGHSLVLLNQLIRLCHDRFVYSLNRAYFDVKAGWSSWKTVDLC
jgi:hypothetical protein